MKNLVLSDYRGSSSGVIALSHFCIDPVTRIVYSVSGNGIHTLNNANNVCGDGAFPGLSWEDHEVSIGNIIAADVITATNSICVITKDGDVITTTMGPIQTETAGSVSTGIVGACWSPDQELLVLVTGENNLMVMTTDFDPVTEVSLDLQAFGENKFINVGWGKKETQFHGTEGKAAAKKVDNVSIIEVPSWDDRKPRISWRGDGQMFAVSHVQMDTNSRCIKIFSRDGVLQATSERLQGLEQPLSWKPSGSVIASLQRLPHKLDVIFFEKNGLKHGEFSIPFKPDEVLVKELIWNQDSSVLLLWIQPLPIYTGGEVAENIIQFWSTSNYHWYLKQELTFEDVVDVNWDNEDPLLVYVLTNSYFHCFSWSFDTDLSTGTSINDLSCIAVIDGKNVNITPLRQAIIPPPMSAYQVSFPESVNCVMFAPSDKNCDPSLESSLDVEDSGFLEECESPSFNSNNLCVFHGANTLTFLTQANVNNILDDCGCHVKVTSAGGNGFTVKTKVHRVFSQHKLLYDLDIASKITDFKHLSNWTWVAKNTLLACYNDTDSFIVVFEVQGFGTDIGTVKVKALVSIESSVICIAKARNSSFVALQLISGEVLKFDFISQDIEPYLVSGNEVIFQNPCKKVCLCPVGSQLLPLGLSSWNRLYLGNHQLFANCSSFYTHDNFLLATTTDHKLHIVPLVMSVLKDNPDDFAASRKVERGARIVTAISQDTKVILQMPRGNLEAISPRALAVHMVKQLLNELKYHRAIDIMRKERIDMNLLYDHNPSEFILHVKHFVKDVGNTQWIDLFLANLNDGDCTTTMYSFNYKFDHNNDNTGGNNKTSGNKIEMVCKALREAMLSEGEEDYLLPILTSYVKMSPSQMDVALKKIRDMKNNKNLSIFADEGLRHLLYIADVNELFNVALGTYDFDLVMMVAEKSQKDPKEYLPFLNELRLLDEQYRKFKINVHLRQFKKALECLKETDGFEEECIDLIIREKLYKDALQVFPASSHFAKMVCQNYANYLVSKNYFGEAALMFSRANNLDEALNAYKQAGMWKMVIVTAEQLNLDVSVINSLCMELVTSLKDKSQFKDAAWVYENYLKNEEEALECLVKASEWEEALRVTYKHKRHDLIDTHIKPGISEQFDLSMAEIERINKTVTQFTSRLATVRETKQKENLDFVDGDKNVEQLDSDLYSDTSTVTGITRSHTSTQASSIKTYRSTKNRRKLERKKYSTKEGSAYEDIGLVAALHDLFTCAYNQATGISSLCKILVTFGSDEDARTLQAGYSELLTLLETKAKEIWPIIDSVAKDIEFGPEVTTQEAVNKMRGGATDEAISLITLRMRELEPHLRHPPPSPSSTTPNWSLQILKNTR